ncbi:MAG: hypothetical protein HOV67_35680 [Kribbellaceae bacterium]|nr:hypothetical protein [Kribbellaceae bacterium]
MNNEWIARVEPAVPQPGPLRGLTMALKDNIDLAGVPTTAGDQRNTQPAERNAFVVDRLIAAGAVPLGKTNLDQYATGLVGTRSPYGPCHSVFSELHVSGGSSSGSAVAVASGQVDFALGTDTAGSGRVPAAFNRLVGIKPSRGLVSARGVVPACRSLDCGPTRCRNAGPDAATMPLSVCRTRRSTWIRCTPRPGRRRSTRPGAWARSSRWMCGRCSKPPTCCTPGRGWPNAGWRSATSSTTIRLSTRRYGRSSAPASRSRRRLPSRASIGWRRWPARVRTCGRSWTRYCCR